MQTVTTRIKTLLLDAGGVLVLPNWNRVSKTLGRYGIKVEASALAEAEPYAKRVLDDLSIVKRTDDRSRGLLCLDLILKRVGISKSSRVEMAIAELETYHATKNLWEHVPNEVPSALIRLRKFGLRLIVVSNANGTLRSHLSRLGLTSYLDLVLDSSDEGVEKPDPRLFTIAMHRARARPESTLHVGDLYHVDIVGARAAGLRAVLLDRAGLYLEYDCHRISTLDELADGLKENRF